MDKKQQVFVSLPFNFKEAHDLLCSSEFDVVINQELPLDRHTFLRESKGCHGIICYPSQTIDKEFLDFVGDQLKVCKLYYTKPIFSFLFTCVSGGLFKR